MSSPGKHLSETEAIRAVIADGAAGDYADIAAAVKQRFGLLVGGRLVEEVVIALNQEAGQQAAPPQAQSPAPALAGETRGRILAFVQEMGGFEQARAAIDELESEMRRLLP